MIYEKIQISHDVNYVDFGVLGQKNTDRKATNVGYY